MEALRFAGKTLKLEYARVPIPKISKPNQVLIKVAYAGVCGTDLHIIDGHFPCSETPINLGHEFSGTVVEVGASVEHLRKGDNVTVDPNDGCFCCDFCHNGNPHYCKIGGISNTIGIHRDGGFATYVLVPMHTVSKLPSSLSLEQGALTEPLSCVAHGFDLVSPIRVGARILIVGAGIIGNLWVSNLHLHGHRKVTVSEPQTSRLDILQKLDTGFDLLTPDQLKKKHEQNPEYLFDVVIDCSGFCPAMEHALTLLDKGGKMLIFGVAPPEGRISVSPYHLYQHEIKIMAVVINPFSFVKAIGIMESMGSRYLDYEKLGIRIFALKEYQEAIKLLKTGQIAKAVFKL